MPSRFSLKARKTASNSFSTVISAKALPRTDISARKIKDLYLNMAIGFFLGFRDRLLCSGRFRLRRISRSDIFLICFFFLIFVMERNEMFFHFFAGKVFRAFF